MPKEYSLGNFMELRLSARRSAFLGFLVLWLILSVVAGWLIKLPVIQAVFGGFFAALLHYASELWHNLGHAAAARRTGKPMEGVLFWGFLATSLYPRDEGQLPREVHIRRALGGPLASLLLSLALGALALALHTGGGVVWWLAVFLFFDNLLVYTLGAFLPLRFLDGGTILYWLRRT
jgi:Zn-dependent protease